MCLSPVRATQGAKAVSFVLDPGIYHALSCKVSELGMPGWGGLSAQGPRQGKEMRNKGKENLRGGWET